MVMVLHALFRVGYYTWLCLYLNRKIVEGTRQHAHSSSQSNKKKNSRNILLLQSTKAIKYLKYTKF